MRSARDRLDEDVDLRGLALAAGGVADHPAHGVAGRNRDQLLAGLERDVGDLVERGIELVKCALRVGIDLDGIDVAVLDRIDLGERIGLGDPLLGLLVVLGLVLLLRHAVSAGPASGNGFGTSTILTGGFSSGSRFAALNTGLSRMGISGTLTRVAQALSTSASVVAMAARREALIWALLE